MWTILIFIVIGMVAGWSASLLIRREKYPTDWGVLFIIGISGSLIAGIIVNLIMGDGFRIAPGGIIGSIAVACLLLWLYTRGAEPPGRQGAGAPDHQVRRHAPRAQGRAEAPHEALTVAGRGRPAGLRPPAAKPLRRAAHGAGDRPGGGGMTFTEAMEWTSRAFEVVAIAVLVAGFCAGVVKALRARFGGREEESYVVLRRYFGRSILLGLEILVAADLIRTVAVDQTWENVLSLGLIVLIRTFLSFSLEVEMDGVWPWRRWRSASRRQARAARRRTPARSEQARRRRTPRARETTRRAALGRPPRPRRRAWTGAGARRLVAAGAQRITEKIGLGDRGVVEVLAAHRVAPLGGGAELRARLRPWRRTG